MRKPHINKDTITELDVSSRDYVPQNRQLSLSMPVEGVVPVARGLKSLKSSNFI